MLPRLELERRAAIQQVFSQVGRKQAEDPRETVVFNAGGGEVNHIVTKAPQKPKFLGAEEPDTTGKDRRAILVEAARGLGSLDIVDNAIIRGGFKIIPDDVVKAIESHPDVLEACVVALPDARLGQVPAAGYRIRTGHSLEEADLRTFLRGKLTAYQVPTKLLAFDDFPRTPSFKPSQPELRKLIEAA
jgi:hypothetical protein